MGVKLSEILNRKKTIPVELGEQTITITYSPNWFSPANRAELTAGSQTFDGYVAKCLCESIIEWDFVDDDGKPIAVDASSVALLGDVVITAIFEAMRDNATIDPTKPVSS